jgi:hypothetical protein
MRTSAISSYNARCYIGKNSVSTNTEVQESESVSGWKKNYLNISTNNLVVLANLIGLLYRFEQVIGCEAFCVAELAPSP